MFRLWLGRYPVPFFLPDESWLARQVVSSTESAGQPTEIEIEETPTSSCRHSCLSCSVSQRDATIPICEST